MSELTLDNGTVVVFPESKKDWINSHFPPKPPKSNMHGSLWLFKLHYPIRDRSRLHGSGEQEPLSSVR